MKVAVWLVMLVGLLWGVPVFADDIAIVKFVEGRVSLKRGSEVIEVQPSAKIQVNDLLMTGKNGRMGLIFNDGSVLTLEKKSFLKVDRFVFKPAEEQFDVQLFLEKGTAVFESGKIGRLAPEKFKFKVPQGTVGIRGTRFLAEVK